jgi:fatty acid desaturase
MILPTEPYLPTILLNDILGTLSGFILFPMSNAVGYRYLHLAHHRYVGDKELDPDEPLVAIPTKYFPLGYLSLCCFQISFGLIGFYLKRGKEHLSELE